MSPELLVCSGRVPYAVVAAAAMDPAAHPTSDATSPPTTGMTSDHGAPLGDGDVIVPCEGCDHACHALHAVLMDEPTSVRVLIVDDDDDYVFVVQRLLVRSGITDVSTAQDAERGIDAAFAVQPDVILLDLSMPGRSGYEALTDLQAAAPAAAIVIVSNFPARRLADKLRARGSVGYIEKRTPPDELVRQILAAAAITEITRRRLSVELPAHASSARSARRAVREALAEADQTLVHDIELLVSELVTNAVIHTSTAPRLEVEMSSRTVRVAVHDHDPTLPARRVPDLGREGGRGLNLLHTIATRWGVNPAAAGKVVWFEIDRAS